MTSFAHTGTHYPRISCAQHSNMFTMLESNLGYGASYTSANSCRSGVERDLTNQQVPATLSYSQMLRMSIEESTEDMGSSHDCVWRSNGVYIASEKAAYMGRGCESVLRKKERSEDDEGARSMKGDHRVEGACSLSMKGAFDMNVCVRQEEGFAENDYGFTCLTLGRGTPPCDRFDVPSASPLTVSRNTSGFTRTCKLCGTSKTPLWRSGPMGAKSLCNACGIRSNKAKKLSAANEEGEQATAGSCSSKSKSFLKQAASSKVTKRKKAAELEAKMMKKKKKKKSAEAGESDGELPKEVKKKKKKQRSVQQQQQQAKLPRLHVNVISSPVKTESSSCVTSRGTPSPCSTQRKPFPPISTLSTQVPHACLHFDSMCHFDDCAFPKDEEQAAFLLMALSCGLVLA